MHSALLGHSQHYFRVCIHLNYILIHVYKIVIIGFPIHLISL